jgi:hypothetical protein
MRALFRICGLKQFHGRSMEKNNQAVRDIGEKIAKVVQDKKTQNINFTVEVKKGVIVSVSWESEYIMSYDLTRNDTI